MNLLRKKTSGSAAFYRALLLVVLPMTLQNLISAAVNSADVIMLGYVSQDALAASSLANQIQFILFLFYTGLASGLTIMAAQYWGRGDARAISLLLGMGLKLSLAVSLVFGLGAVLAPVQLMHIFTNEQALIDEGARYLEIVGWSYLFMGVSQIYECMIKSTERVKAATLIAGVTLLINVVLNAMFIFGLLGFPKLGIRGVAIATLTARVAEVLICCVDAARQKQFPIDTGILSAWSNTLFRDFCHYSLPALGNEFLWGAAFSAYTVILGHLGSEIVAANSIISALRDLCSVFVFGLAYGAAIVIGKKIGAGFTDEVRGDARKILRITFFSCLVAGLLMVCLKPLIFLFTSLTPTAQGYLDKMVFINCIYILGMGLNTTMICGLFRAGGDARFGFILDVVAMWGIFVPLGFVCAFVLHFPPLLVYAVTCCDEFFKLPINFYHYKKGNWIRNITREDQEL